MSNFLFSSNPMPTSSNFKIKISRFVFWLLALLLMLSVMSMTSGQEIYQTNFVSEAEYYDNNTSWTETAKLTIDDGVLIGRSLDVDNNVLVIGAIDAAYVVVRQGESWTDNPQIAKLTASNGENNNFGVSVSISGDTVIVGASADLYNKGSAYVFVKPVSGWVDMTETAKLRASDGYYRDCFGHSVAINGDTVVVGSGWDDDKGYDAGSAYVFVRPPDGWKNMTQTAKLLPERSSGLATFGNSVAVSGNTIVVGAYNDRYRGIRAGTAYVFEKPAQGWSNMTETAELIPSDNVEYDLFGVSVDISGTTVVVGAYSKQTAYIFERSNDNWVTTTEVARLSASDTGLYDEFGISTAIQGKTIIVGARSDHTLYDNTGSTYIFMRQDNMWASMNEITKLVASDRTENARFGETVAVSGSTVIIGAPRDNNDNGGVYFFEIEQETE